MASMLQSAGVTTTQLSSALRDNSGGGGIYNALNLLHKDLTAGGLSPAMQAAMISRSFGGGRMGSTIEMMYNNIGGLGQKTRQIDKNGSVSNLMKDWNAETQTFDFQLKKLGGTVETFGTQFGKALLPPLTEGVKLLSDTAGWFGKNKLAAEALGGVVMAVLAPAIGLYLYRALLSAGGGIKNLINGYGMMIRGQTAEQAALAKTDASLTLATGETYRLVAADRALAGASVGGAGAGAAGGARGLFGKAMGAATIGAVGYTAASMVSGGNGYTDNPSASRSAQLRSFGGAVLGGATTGAMIGTMFGPEGTIIGGALGAGTGAVYAEHNQIGHALSSGWDDLFGGGNHAAAARTRPTLQANVNVFLDGKQLANAVAKQTKATASRT
jgi:hypothetical protein